MTNTSPERYESVLSGTAFSRSSAAKKRFPFARCAWRRARLPELAADIRADLAALTEIERAKVASVDAPAEVFGRLLGRVFSYAAPEEDSETLFDLGNALGKYIYAADAAEDYDADIRQKSYNPYVLLYGGACLSEEQRSNIHTSLVLTLEGVGSALEYLPFGNALAVEHILKNTVYVGLYKRLDFLRADSEQEKGKL